MSTDEKTGSAAEIAFMAGLTTKQVHSLVRIGALPAALVAGTRNRRFAPLAAVFAAFYFQTHEELTPVARKRAIAMLCARVSNSVARVISRMQTTIPSFSTYQPCTARTVDSGRWRNILVSTFVCKHPVNPS